MMRPTSFTDTACVFYNKMIIKYQLKSIFCNLFMHDVCNQQVYTAGADQFTGEYKDGNLYRGTQTFGNGDVYEGGFSDNKFHGEGTYILFFEIIIIIFQARFDNG